jgi:hypothetical protein
MPKISRDNPLDWTDVEQLLWSISLEGGPDLQVGDSSTVGWAGFMHDVTRQELVEWLVKEEGYGPANKLDRWLAQLGVPKGKSSVILRENTDGIRTVTMYAPDNHAAARREWARLSEALEERPGEGDDPDMPLAQRQALMESRERADRNPRTLHDIATEIWEDWPRPYFGAVPYLQAMSNLEHITDRYGYDDADMIVRYFLSNAKTWKGEAARRIKAELKAMLEGPRYRGNPQVILTHDADAAHHWSDFYEARDFMAKYVSRLYPGARVETVEGRFLIWATNEVDPDHGLAKLYVAEQV